ncbi:bifunctional tetrahydrofolate synthase/dihydrofolate synthase [Spongiibacter sp. KMU-158]|uniref:Dihydrofolate synthase/folylpolyglutamate synthase n=1 Tax=Spongiibacter pelagi TaxID=2760804 RepID=A0A927GX43_9GAMM|nr:bifunctional tetrahydrofolate synthase/dihydrofolate synthase [Spongiibacter pelagi]MBD2859054.1 bifunctional tetrahydrofolate synthase/dihydrofolate synthase [Spongiibacter pelagi]
MRFTQLDAWLRWLETLHPKPIDLGLERVQTVARALNIHFSIPVITVAGTNGKGSTVALLDAILTAEGKRVGCYTSPHLLHYNERVKLAGELATDQQFCDIFAQIDAARGDISLSYFEFGTLAALCLFMAAELDVVVLEVGLGGRLDAVNIIDADIAIVTSVALDHEAWLGSDRDTIGREKAGVFRSGKPAIFGDSLPLASVIDYAESQQVPLLARDRDFGFDYAESAWHWWGQQAGERREILNLPLPRVLLDNAASCLQAIEFLPFAVSEAAIRTGLQTVSVSARQQRFDFNGIEVWLDVAHNPAAVARLAEALHISSGKGCSGQGSSEQGKTVAVFAIMADKAVDAVLEIMFPLVDCWALPQLLDNPRALSAEVLAAKLESQAAEVMSQGQAMAATLDNIIPEIRAGDRLVIFGSFFTVADALAYF